MNLSQNLRDLLHLNRTGDMSQGLRSRLLGPVLAAIAILVAFGTVFTGGLIDAGVAGRAGQIIAVGMLALIWFLWKRGFIDFAAHLLVWGFWTLDGLVVLSESGRASHWIVPQFLLVILSRFILNGRIAIFLGVATAGFDFAIYQFDLYQYVPAEWRELAYGNDWVAIAIAFFFLLFIFYLADIVLRESLRQSQITEGRYRSLFEKTNDLIIQISPDQRILTINQQGADLLEYKIDELVGKPYIDLVSPEEKQKVRENFVQLEKAGISPFFERVLVRKDGSRCQFEFNATAVKDEHGKLLFFQGVARDLTDRKRLEEQLRYSLEEMQALAMQDPLTGLLNRRAITDHAEAEWHRSARERRPMCLALIDLDNLKDVNDNQGHQMGDQAIVELANVIRNSRRRYDWAGRWGGDEFMLVLPGANLVDAHEVADRLRVQYEEAPLVRDMPENARARVSIGVACYSGRPSEEVPLDLLIKQADQALYQAKLGGKNRVELFRTEG